MMESQNVLLIGGAGYVGARLAPLLADAGYNVRIYDLLIYGQIDALNRSSIEVVRGDVRDLELIAENVAWCDFVIHLACISNDPSFELNPDLGKSINFDCFEPLVDLCVKSRVKRFIYASSSSVYGVKDEPDVHEDMSLEPLTDYSKYKVMCEQVLNRYLDSEMTISIVRPATVCGYSPRQRLDVVVNILTNLAYNKRSISIFGGNQLRPNIHIEDMCKVYLLMLQASSQKIHGQAFNAGYENMAVSEIGELVRSVVGLDVKMNLEPTDDNRSYHISSRKISRELGFLPKRTVKDAIVELVGAFEDGLLPASLSDSRYFNIKKMQEIGLE